MKRAYLYPISGRDANSGLYNPYLDDLMASLKDKIVIVNENDPSNSGLLNIVKYLPRIDLIFFNWIENLPERKGYWIQFCFLRTLLTMARPLGIKVVWTMHNKLSHTKENYAQKEKVFRLMLRKSDLVITHSSAGIEFGEKMVPGSSAKIKYLAHPVKDRRLAGRPKKTQDVLIWGTIAPYKGIDVFLDFLKEKGLENRYSILIVGKIPSQDYAEKINAYATGSVRVENRFIEDELLQNLIAQSKFVLFTYTQDSILSSGALMDSLGYGASIIGPDVGAFTDLAKEGIITTFTDLPELQRKMEQLIATGDPDLDYDNLDRFLQENSWNSFATNLGDLLEKTVY